MLSHIQKTCPKATHKLINTHENVGAQELYYRLRYWPGHFPMRLLIGACISGPPPLASPYPVPCPQAPRVAPPLLAATRLAYFCQSMCGRSAVAGIKAFPVSVGLGSKKFGDNAPRTQLVGLVRAGALH
ncbi:unnamed protein product, partial [Brenthis ino]